jgi:hypothetical protein
MCTKEAGRPGGDASARCGSRDHERSFGKLPVTVLSGFLGAGKTWLNQVLKPIRFPREPTTSGGGGHFFLQLSCT